MKGVMDSQVKKNTNTNPDYSLLDKHQTPLYTSIYNDRTKNYLDNDRIGNSYINQSQNNTTVNKTMFKVKEEKIAGHLIIKIDNIVINAEWGKENLEKKDRLLFSVSWDNNVKEFDENIIANSCSRGDGDIDIQKITARPRISMRAFIKPNSLSPIVFKLHGKNFNECQGHFTTNFDDVVTQGYRSLRHDITADDYVVGGLEMEIEFYKDNDLHTSSKNKALLSTSFLT